MQEEAEASEDAGEDECAMGEEAEAEPASRPVAEVRGAGDHLRIGHALFVRVHRTRQVTARIGMTKTNPRTRSRTSIPSQRKGQKVRERYATLMR